MNNDQATELAKRIINTMRPTPPLVEWVEVLELLDLDTALVTFRHLRDRTDDGLRIATFLTAYQQRDDSATTRERRASDARLQPSPHCEHCRGTGYEPGPSRWGTVGGEPYEYTTVQPCRCTRPTSTQRPVAAATPSLLEDF